MASDRARWIPLDGAANFRDLGGYESRDGRRVKWGVVYRSNALCRLSDADMAQLSKLKIQLVCDLRTEDEQRREPDRLPNENPPEMVSLSIRPRAANQIEEALRAGRVWKTFAEGDLSSEDLQRSMANFYRSYARDHTRQYGTLLRGIAEGGNRPSLMHCAGGKDRTGFAAALLLRCLQVSQEQILEDYLLTNRMIEPWIEDAKARNIMPQARAVIEARTDYLLAAFDEIDEVYGSFDAYLHQGLRVEDEHREGLRTALLE